MDLTSKFQVYIARYIAYHALERVRVHFLSFTCNSTDEGQGPKRLEGNPNHKTHFCLLFFVEHSLTYFLSHCIS